MELNLVLQGPAVLDNITGPHETSTLFNQSLRGEGKKTSKRLLRPPQTDQIQDWDGNRHETTVISTTRFLVSVFCNSMNQQC